MRRTYSTSAEKFLTYGGCQLCYVLLRNAVSCGFWGVSCSFQEGRAFEDVAGASVFKFQHRKWDGLNSINYIQTFMLRKSGGDSVVSILQVPKRKLQFVYFHWK